MSEFLRSNEWQWRLARTVVQGVIGVLIANVDLIVGWPRRRSASRLLLGLLHQIPQLTAEFERLYYVGLSNLSPG